MSASPEAKQAARDWRRDTLTQLGEREAYAEGYDTATATAREFAAMQDKIILAASQENAKLREALHILARGRWPDRMTQRELDTVNEALAHQPLDSARDKQPSAITTNEQAYRDGTLSQPSAPTADVEKLEWRLWSQGDNKVVVYQNNATETVITPETVSLEQGEWLCERHSEALAQTRAPLVEAIDVAIALLDQCKDISARKVLNAVLTGTGEHKHQYAAQGDIWVCDKCGEEWQQALDQQQQTNAEIVEKTTRK